MRKPKMVNGEWGTAVKIAVLCILAFQYVKAFSTPAIADIAAAYPMVSATDVKLIESIPSLMAIPGSLLVIVLERVMKKRSILWIAMIGSVLSGVVAGIMPETLGGFYGILACRAVLGLARGIVYPMSATFIADLFTGETRDRMLGFRTAAGGVWGIAFMLIGGFLAAMSWRYSFIGYVLLVPIILMIAFNLPEPDVKPLPIKSGKSQLGGGAIWLVIALAFIVNAFVFCIFTNMSLCVAGTGIGNAATSGTILSSVTCATAVGGFLYGAFIKGKLGGFDMPIAMSLMTIGLFLLTKLISVPGYFAGSIVFGLGFGMFFPPLMMQSVKLVPRESATMAISIIAIAQNLGQFCSAYILNFAGDIFGIAPEVPALAGFMSTVPLCVGLCIILFVTMGILRKRCPDKVAGLPEKKVVEEKPAE
ncbi:MAG: MFS transporter [Eggerthellaceae bacterium]|nr:MFS transporter [Eggerthellaceae bacterium]